MVHDAMKPHHSVKYGRLKGSIINKLAIHGHALYRFTTAYSLLIGMLEILSL